MSCDDLYDISKYLIGRLTSLQDELARTSYKGEALENMVKDIRRINELVDITIQERLRLKDAENEGR